MMSQKSRYIPYKHAFEEKKMVILIIGTFTICMIWNWEITVLAFVGVILSFNGFIEFPSGFSFNSKRSWYFLNF